MATSGSRTFALMMSRIASLSSPAVEPDARELEALLVDLRRVRRDAARHLAADLDPVRDRHGERDELPAMEDRPDEAHVARVRPALVRVVGHVDVPGAHRLEAELADRRLDLGPNVPVKSVSPLVCATTCARRSVMPQAKSSTSYTIGLMLVRASTTAISSAAAWSLSFRISSVKASGSPRRPGAAGGTVGAGLGQPRGSCRTACRAEGRGAEGPGRVG